MQHLNERQEGVDQSVLLMHGGALGGEGEAVLERLEHEVQHSIGIEIE